MVSEVESGVEIDQAYPSEASTNSPEAVKVPYTINDPRQLRALRMGSGKQRMGSPAANGLCLDWTRCIPSHSHFALERRP